MILPLPRPMIRTAITAALLLAALPAHAADPALALVVASGEGVGSAKTKVVRSTVSDLIVDLGYDPVPEEKLEEAVKLACTDPVCSKTGEPAALLTTLGAPLLLVMQLIEEGEEIRIDIFIHDLSGAVQDASITSKMSAVLAKSVKLLLEVMPGPGSLPPAQPVSVQPPAVDPGMAVPLAVHDHHHTSPCSGQSCSGHGRCVEVQGLPACACDEGYAPDTATGLTCQTAIHEPALPEDQSIRYWARARRLAIAGFVLDTLGIISLTGGWVFAGAACGDVFCAMLGFIPSAALMHGIAGPLKLHGLTIANKYSGRKPVDGLAIAGWVTYALTLASLAPMPFTPLMMSEEAITVIPIVYTAMHVVSVVITFVAGGRALRLASEVREEKQAASFVPYVSPVPGGISLGLTGTF